MHNAFVFDGKHGVRAYLQKIEDNTNVAILFVGVSQNFVHVVVFLPSGGLAHPTTWCRDETTQLW